jgi:subtilisin family serine protease
VRPLRHISSGTVTGQFSVTSLRPLPAQNVLNPLDLVKLTPLMRLANGRVETTIGLIDGPVVAGHPDLTGARIREIPGKPGGTCARASSAACMHGTFVAGILCAKRDSTAPAICPNCTLLVRPIFAETTSANGPMPSATPQELATAIIDCIGAGAHVINLSAALAQLSSKGERSLEEALNYSAKRGVIVVAAAGNQGTLGSSAITRHPWVIPVIAYDLRGRPIGFSNLGNSIGRRGLGAPGDGVTSLGADGEQHTFGGTSTAAPFVTGSIALLWSEFPGATAAEVKRAVTQSHGMRRMAVVPPLLDAWAAYQVMATTHRDRRLL